MATEKNGNQRGVLLGSKYQVNDKTLYEIMVGEGRYNKFVDPHKLDGHSYSPESQH